MKRSFNINKNVLNGFLNQAISHNKVLEESEMWKKKRELEEADKAEKDNKRRNRSSCLPSSKPADSSPPAPPKAAKQTTEDIDDLKVLLALYKDAYKKPEEKWDHSGFKELYPDIDHKHDKPSRSDSSSERECMEKKRRHSKHIKEKKKSSKKKKKKKKKHKE